MPREMLSSQIPFSSCCSNSSGEANGKKYKRTPRSTAFQKDLHRRINRAIGQLNAINKMLDENRYCGDILLQLSAAEAAVHKASALLLKNHLETCVADEIENGNREVIAEAMELIDRFARR